MFFVVQVALVLTLQATLTTENENNTPSEVFYNKAGSWNLSKIPRKTLMVVSSFVFSL